uniref:Uncharacterized protein n=1 Tax=Oryza meridionalis TaxID=40149 RepID=A0A0E0E9Q3_9ORYZ
MKNGELVALTAHFDTCESTVYNKGCDGLERTKLDKNMHETMEVQSWPHVRITKMRFCHLTQCQMQAQAQISDSVRISTTHHCTILLVLYIYPVWLST